MPNPGYAINYKSAAVATPVIPTGWPNGWTFPGPPWPPGLKPTSGGTTWARTYNFSGTSLGGVQWITPFGNFTLSTAELDSASLKTSTLGSLVFLYSGAGGYAGRGTVTIIGTGAYNDSGAPVGAEYQFSLGTLTGSVLLTGTVVVDTGGVRYTSTGEAYANQLLAATTSINPLKGDATNTPVSFRGP